MYIKCISKARQKYIKLYQKCIRNVSQKLFSRHVYQPKRWNSWNPDLWAVYQRSLSEGAKVYQQGGGACN